jgi:DNA polymerase III alpha subunit (gram-positive type)
MLKRNLIVFDTETSGLDPEDGCEVVHLYAKAFNYWNLEPHVSGDFEVYIKPQRPEKAEAGALKVIGSLWNKALTEGIHPKIAWKNYLKWVDSVNETNNAYGKPIKIAHNQDFDSKFTKYHCREYNLVNKSSYGWEYPWGFVFDSMGFAFMLFESDPTLENLKLNTIIDKFNVSRASPEHNAKEDVELLSQFVIRCLKFSRQCFKKLKIE